MPSEGRESSAFQIVLDACLPVMVHDGIYGLFDTQFVKIEY